MLLVTLGTTKEGSLRDPSSFFNVRFSSLILLLARASRETFQMALRLNIYRQKVRCGFNLLILKAHDITWIGVERLPVHDSFPLPSFVITEPDTTLTVNFTAYQMTRLAYPHPNIVSEDFPRFLHGHQLHQTWNLLKNYPSCCSSFYSVLIWSHFLPNLTSRLDSFVSDIGWITQKE